MWKSVFILAVAANAIYVVSTEDNQCTRPNEVYDLCPAKCPFRTCGIDDRLINCIPSPTVGDPDCPPPACRCANGYFRDDKGNCVKWDDCPKCDNPNEEYDACPAPCPPRRCDVNEALILCQVPPQPGDPDCKPGCRCSDNYARNDEGICIPKDQCPVSCKGDPNARPGCGVNCGRLCSNYKDKDVACIQVCYEDGCDCKENYVLDTNTGKCVLPKQCTPTCKANEVFSNCTQAICRAQDCEQKGKPIACSLVEVNKCKKGCVCAPNYLRDSNGDCVPEDQCNESCGGDPNAEPGCGVNCGRLCSNYRNGDQIACPAICKLDGCDCKEGYVLNEKSGKCVLPEQCPEENEVSCGGDSNAKPGCGINCGRLCSDYKNPEQVSCPAVVCNVDGCDCKDGYVLDDKSGKCVLPDQCPVENEESCGGDPNAKPGCGVNCGRLCSNYKNGDQIACPEICNLNGCDCKKGYVLNEKTNRCVLPEQCLTDSCRGDPNAKPGCGVNCGRLCSNYKNGDQVACAAVCYPDGCDCKKGYVLDEKSGKCVLPAQCPEDEESCNGDPNAKPGCGVNCGRLCSNYKNSEQIACPAICHLNGCDCKEGYVLDEKTNRCVLPEQCQQCKGPNEFFSCGQECDNVCATLDQQNRTNCPIINIKCNEKCYCEDGYARDDNNICVPIDQCPVTDSCRGDPNAIPGCGVNCGRHCSNYKIGDQISCAAVCYPDGCDCKKGYVLDEKSGKCVLPAQCPEDKESCGGDPNAKPGCGVNCGRLCSNYKKANQIACPAICHLNGCDCKEGYVLDEKTNRCVLPEQCQQCNGPNEFFSCGQECDNVCATLDQQNRTNCPIINIKCNEKCYCEDGYARDDNNICVPIDQCPVTDSCRGDPNAIPGCGVNCGRHCSNYKIGDQISCAAVCYPDGCDCKKGYVLDEKSGKCVLPAQCPEDEVSCDGDPNAKPGCGINCGRLCSNYKNGDQIACPKICKLNGCDCKEGYVLDEKTNRCVLPEQCSVEQNQCNQPNEEYQQCPDCSPGTCDSIGQKYNCPLQPADQSKCKGECRCKPGYYRNKIGECITKAQCQQCNGPNEFFSCGQECDNVCATLDQQNRTNCPIINIKCNEKCYCEDGYARDDNNICVPIDQCPDGCEENERYVECPDAECLPKTCAEAGFVACPREAGGRCTSEPECVCKIGYLRNSDDVCVPQNECPSCGGDLNARPGCGQNCGRLCSNYQNSEGIVCPAICHLYGCECIEGYVLDTNTGKCVLPEQCSPPCGQNEVYTNCANGGCDKRNCSQINQPQLCIDPLKCEGGCVCQEGYLRNSNGVCVPQNQCQEKCPEGEILSTCPPTQCDAEYCPKSRDTPQSCPTPKKCNPPRCVCGFNSRRCKLTGECIPISECPPFRCTGQNEVYNSCPPICPGENCTDYINNSTCDKFRIGILLPCRPSCRCKKGTYRNSEGICVSSDECERECESS